MDIEKRLLRLRAKDLTIREIAAVVGLSKSAVSKRLAKAQVAALAVVEAKNAAKTKHRLQTAPAKPARSPIAEEKKPLKESLQRLLNERYEPGEPEDQGEAEAARPEAPPRSRPTQRPEELEAARREAEAMRLSWQAGEQLRLAADSRPPLPPTAEAQALVARIQTAGYQARASHDFVEVLFDKKWTAFAEWRRRMPHVKLD